MNMNSKYNWSRRHVLLGTLALLSLGITGIRAATPVPENVEWVLVEINGKAVEAPAGGEMKDATLKLDAAKMQASGVSFVNHYGAKYELNDSKLKFGPMMCTRMAGPPDAMDAERDYLAMLEGVNGWRIADGKLELIQGEKVVARFTERAAAVK